MTKCRLWQEYFNQHEFCLENMKLKSHGIYYKIRENHKYIYINALKMLSLLMGLISLRWWSVILWGTHPVTVASGSCVSLFLSVIAFNKDASNSVNLFFISWKKLQTIDSFVNGVCRRRLFSFIYSSYFPHWSSNDCW